MKRYNHDRSNIRLASGMMGLLYPSCSRHCVAGTTLRGGVNANFQLAPMVHQALTQMRVDTWAISGADRILWKDAEAFYTGGETGEERPEVPYIMSPADGGWPVGSLADALGFPTGVPNLKTNALPFRLYAMWWNEHVRVEGIQDPLPVSFESGKDTTTNTELQRVNWPKDMFTTAKLEQQLGDEVVIPVASSVPFTIPAKSITISGSGNERPVKFTADGKTLTLQAYDSRNTSGDHVGYTPGGITGAKPISATTSTALMYANIPEYNGAVDLSQATGVLPSDFNFSMARSKWKSRRNLYGSRYKDWLSYLGIRYSDKRLQLPSTHAHGRSTVDISAVLQTAPGSNSFVGERAGVASSYASCSYKTYFEEPTTVIHLWCVRPAPVYVNMNPPEWDFEVREDIYTPEFAHVGMVEWKKGTLFPTGTASDAQRVGWRNRYDEHRVGFNDVSGAFKTTNLSYHQGRVFGTSPELNSDFLECNPSNRIFANLNGDHIESAAIRNVFLERNMVSPNGDPRF